MLLLCPGHVKEDLFNYCRDTLLPYMTLKSPNKKHSAYGLKHVVEKEIGRYVSEEELIAALKAFDIYPSDGHYPISEEYFKRIYSRWEAEGRGYYG